MKVSEPKMPLQVRDCAGNQVVYASEVEKFNAAWQAYAAGIRAAVLAEVTPHIGAIAQYGMDTLSGRFDGPTDREWFKDGVREMTRRAGALITTLEQQP